MQKYIKIPIFFFCLLPILIIVYQIIFNQLGPEPVKKITQCNWWVDNFVLS